MRSKPREQVAKHARRGPEGDEEGVRKEQCGYREHRGLRGLCGGAPSREPKEEDLQTLLGAPEPLCPRPRPGSVTILEARKEVTAYNAHTLQLTNGRGSNPGRSGPIPGWASDSSVSWLPVGLGELPPLQSAWKKIIIPEP